MPRAADRFGGKPFSQINLTPLVGVLLAVFALLATVQPQPAVGADVGMQPLNPPIGHPPRRPDPVMIHVSSAGRISLNGRPSSQDRLVADVLSLRGSPEDSSPSVRGERQRAYLDADNRASYGTVFDVYRALQAAGVDVVYYTRNPEDPPRES